MSTDGERYLEAQNSVQTWIKSPLPPLFPDSPTASEIVKRRDRAVLESPIHKVFPPHPEPYDRQQPDVPAPRCQVGGTVTARIAGIVSCGLVGDVEMTDIVINDDWVLDWDASVPFFVKDPVGSFTFTTYDPLGIDPPIVTYGTFIVDAFCLDGLWSFSVYSNSPSTFAFSNAPAVRRGVAAANTIACGGGTTYAAGGTVTLL